MKWSTETKIFAGVTALVLLFCSVSLLCYRNSSRFISDNEWVGRSHDVIKTADALMNDIQMTRVSIRGYLFSGDERQLGGYPQQSEQMLTHLSKLRLLVDDTPEQRNRVELLRPLVLAKLERCRELIRARHEEGLNAALKIAREMSGEPTDELRSIGSSILSAELARLDGRVRTAAIAARHTITALVVNGVTGLVLVTLSLLGIRRDIRMRRRALAALSASESVLRSYYDSAAMMMGVVEMVGEGLRHVSDNSAATRFFGGCPTGRTAAELGVPSEIIAQWMHHYRLARRTGEPSRFEYLHEGFDGGRWLEVTVSHIAGSNLLAPRFCYIVTDVTVRHRAEESLRRTISLQRAILDGASHAIIATGVTGTITLLNPAAERMLGYSCEELVNCRTPEMIHDPAEVAARAATLSIELGRTIAPGFEVFVAYAMQGRSEQREWTYIRKDGSRLPVLLSVTALRSDSGEFNGFLGIAQDITQRKRAESELLDLNHDMAGALEVQGKMTSELALAKDAAEAASRAKTDFLANMSHEIRTPMNAILGYSEILQELAPAGSEQEEGVQIVRRNAEHLMQLINDVLDVSKIEAGAMSVDRVQANVPSLIGELTSLLRARAAQKSLSLDVTLEGSVPAYIETDPLRLKQVLMNLIGNAIKFTDQGGIRLVISAAPAEGEKCTFRCDVVDTGIGMTADQMSRLFRPFSQVDESSTRRFSGTGLGLVISRRFAKMLGGDLTVRSEPNKGSIFSVTIDAGPWRSDLPFVGDAGELAFLCSDVPVPAVAAIWLRGRILVAEDGADNQRLICAYLDRAGVEKMVVDNGRTALEAYLQDREQGGRFDLILMDMQMPEMDGYEATARIRASGYEGPIVALTASAMTGDRERCLASGCSEYLTKPINRARLLQCLSQYLPSAPQEPVAIEIKPRNAASESVAATLDRSTLVSEFASDEQVGPILGDFVADLPRSVQRMHSFLESRRVADLSRIVHQLKGSGGGYGFATITEAAARAELLLKSLPDSAAEICLQGVTARVDELIAVLRRVEGYDPAREAQSCE